MAASSTTTIVVAIVLTAVCLFFANTAVVTHASVGLMKTMTAIQDGLDKAESDSLRSDLAGLQLKLAALHSEQNKSVNRKAPIAANVLHCARAVL